MRPAARVTVTGPEGTEVRYFDLRENAESWCESFAQVMREDGYTEVKPYPNASRYYSKGAETVTALIHTL